MNSIDIHGNDVYVDDWVYTSHPLRAGSKSARLLYCHVVGMSETGATLILYCPEGKREFRKTSMCCVKPK